MWSSSWGGSLASQGGQPRGGGSAVCVRGGGSAQWGGVWHYIITSRDGRGCARLCAESACTCGQSESRCHPRCHRQRLVFTQKTLALRVNATQMQNFDLRVPYVCMPSAEGVSCCLDVYYIWLVDLRGVRGEEPDVQTGRANHERAVQGEAGRLHPRIADLRDARVILTNHRVSSQTHKDLSCQLREEK